MVDSSNSLNSLKAMIIGTASIMLSIGSVPNYMPKNATDKDKPSYECILENPCDYLLKYEAMTQLRHDRVEQIIEIPIVKKIKVKYNKPVKLNFESVEDEKGFII